MAEWSFILCLDGALSPEQADAFDHCDAFADGSVAYTLGPKDPTQYPEHNPDAPELKELVCDVEAPTLLDAVTIVVRNIRLIPGLRAVGARRDNDDDPEASREIAVADLSLRLAAALDGMNIPGGVLRSLGLPDRLTDERAPGEAAGDRRHRSLSAPQ